MISLQTEDLLKTSISDLLIPAEKVAHVQIGNPLEHALLVLIKSGYSAIPVLDASYKLHGLISNSMILDSVLGIERIELEKLDGKKVEEVMEKEIPRLYENDPFHKALGLTINNPFVCVVDDNGYFIGILTRRAILKLFNKQLHPVKK